MIVAAHQPNYLPWIGFFEKMARADCFVIVDHVQFERQNFQNRNRIKLADGVRWLTVPVHRGRQADRICDKEIVAGASIHTDWQRRSWLTLANAYAAAPYFSTYAEELRAVYERPWQRLVELNVELIELCRRWLGITTPTLRSSTLAVTDARTGMIVQFCKQVGADTYLSGTGGSKHYLDLGLLKEQGIAVAWQKFVHPTYAQLHGPFVSHLSVIDLLFNCGPHSRALMLGESVELSPASGQAA